MLGGMGELSFGQENAMVTYANLERQSSALGAEPPRDASDLASTQSLGRGNPAPSVAAIGRRVLDHPGVARGVRV